MKKAILIFIIFALLIFIFARIQIYVPLSADSAERIFRAEAGDSLAEIAVNLKNQDFIRGDVFFSIYVYLQGKESALKAGDYLISSSMSIKEIADKIISGETEGLKITIIEGWNIMDIAEYLEDKGICQPESFLRVVNSLDGLVEEFDFLSDKPERNNLEGYLFPDTYWVKPIANPEEIVRILLTNFGKKITTEMRTEIQSQGKTIFEIIIMASIIEKEVAIEQDREIVSGIFWKRLKNHYPLQSCSTVAYALGIDKWRYSVEDTQIESPYNTYKYAGLPAGPISNPGLSAIKAAIYPKESNYNYFMSKPDGETIFSRTLQEHNLAIQKYLK
ncbi:endolytic transglycosylase MltG [Patescibacteria group bacterium]|nr:endolytic transglycosylase MltG [Patescibacteria group bacterium]MBU4162090.1 endolytic transglycosylase MltG [Patescibacteria group bacterium]